jgi:hypothetical protein
MIRSRPRDPFRPRDNPERLLYDAFQAAAKERKNKPVGEWLEYEVQKVWEAAKGWAEQNKKPVPSLRAIKIASTYATGHIDYGARWAYAICEFWRKRD